MLPAILLALASSQATHTTSATTLHHGVDSHLTVVAADGAPTPDFSLYDITSGPSQLAGVATYNGTELTTVLECFGEGFTEGVGLVCATGGTWTESSDGVDDDDWPGAWSDHTNEAFEMVGSGADALLTPSPTLFDAVSGKDVFVEAVYWPDVSQNQALIDPDDGYGYSSVRCFNLTTTPVYLGGSNVNTSTLGYPICTDTASCPESAITVDGQNVYGIVASGSTTVTCIKGK
jgi:hypothetical protein